jgi:hypothetical protein
LFALFLFLGIFFILIKNKSNEKNINDTQNKESVSGRSSIFGSNREDLVSFSITAGSKVSGVATYQGEVKGGYFFEGNILVNILDGDKNLLKASNAMATSDWMTIEPVSFEGNVDFTNLPAGPAYIEIKNDNASGLPEHDKNILIPIIIEN